MNYSELLSSFLIDLQSLYRKNISISGASFPQILALSIIPDDGIEMSALSKKIGIDNSTATRLVMGLEKKGWVNRRSATYDKRVIQVTLTKDGDEIQIQLERQFDSLGAAIEREVDPLDRNEMIEYVSSLHWILSKLILKNDKIV
ncbi:MAG: MarR family transcriptional regulator [Candidatus Marinimicrobia bacterium]|mgnify:FL=1|jgi:MarR family transcriptional regulator, organic hydroperoxide resistance regulator|nr:MarR family transcriptional regulator [Candidatus Neomarinimicrobiota bacterium]MBT3849430.1 MarR family transcriptional regulator [Candidatus Neomarinimicrobiota bacterium]MBT4054070.1 MarR family transcriptional regulator [Candidatus Neomarinimicrobiota bacterium]MBT4369437.1 MarR family transcriptional regulator [Candidatus Neomarinimicrobiota bacterium]MBT4660931.1 MarR family transcriptional regulator [Candidatus Neomarinimicrobiota bacterium]